jgi:hypothetical protein
MGPIVLGAVIALIALVLALGGSRFAQRAAIMIGGLVAVTLLAIIWFVLRPA